MVCGVVGVSEGLVVGWWWGGGKEVVLQIGCWRARWGRGSVCVGFGEGGESLCGVEGEFWGFIWFVEGVWGLGIGVWGLGFGVWGLKGGRV